MTNGISIYLGLDNTPEENIELIKKASARGIKRIFTSLHIPETDKNKLKDELQHILQIARKESMDVITDVSPATTELLDLDGFSLDYFARLGLTTLRLDYGFGVEKIAEMSQNTLGIKIQLNASTITKDYLKALIRLGANADQLEASHNFFPRENTGLDEDFVWQKTSLLHKYHIDGMVYYHYYFNGKLLLEKPAENLLKWKDIEMPVTGTVKKMLQCHKNITQISGDRHC